MEEIFVEIAIIGSGPAGQKAAIQAAKLDKNVLVIEKSPETGGSCLYSGTMPSKTLREAIIDLTGFYERSFYGPKLSINKVSINDLNFRLARVIEDERKMVYRQFKKNGIRVIHGIARFESPHMLMLFDNDLRLCYQVHAEKIIIATGSKPRNPHEIPFDDDVILDSTRLLSIDRVPETMLVLGGGIIGSEYASFFAALGTEVIIIDKRDHILPLLDTEIGVHLQTSLTNIGLQFIGNVKPTKVERRHDRAYLALDDGSSLESDMLLYALGREANVDHLQIQNAGITLDPHGYIPVNPLFQTFSPNIYAVGDVIGGPCLASTSMEQGRLAARHACGADTHYFPSFYPIGIYTIPEISSCGHTEDFLRLQGYHYEVGRAYYYEIARGHITGSNTGMFKILFHAETLEILGVHVIGRGATEVIHIGQIAMSFRAKIDYFIDQVFNYPTFAEGYRVAALNGINKIKRKI